MVSAALVKKFWHASVSCTMSFSRLAYLYDLVDLLDMLLVRLRHLVGTANHLAVVLDPSVAVGRHVGIRGGAFGCWIPLVVGAGGIGLKVVGRRGASRRRTRVHCVRCLARPDRWIGAGLKAGVKVRLSRLGRIKTSGGSHHECRGRRGARRVTCCQSKVLSADWATRGRYGSSG
jgi:hypothetical protein